MRGAKIRKTFTGLKPSAKSKPLHPGRKAAALVAKRNFLTRENEMERKIPAKLKKEPFKKRGKWINENARSAAA
jgi:hypothetical protein